MSMDNRSAIDVAHNPEHFGRMKHVARRHFFIRECVENHLIRVPFVRTDANDADFFTKVLPARKFFPLRDKIMNARVVVPVPERLFLYIRIAPQWRRGSTSEPRPGPRSTHNVPGAR